MRLRPMLGVLLVVFSVMAVGLAAGCGAADDDSPEESQRGESQITLAQWSERYDATCVEYYDQQEDLEVAWEQAATREEGLELLAESVRHMQEVLDAVTAFPLPAEGTETVERLLAVDQNMVTTLEQLIEAARVGDQAAVFDLQLLGEELEGKAGWLERELGADRCAALTEAGSLWTEGDFAAPAGGPELSELALKTEELPEGFVVAEEAYVDPGRSVASFQRDFLGPSGVTVLSWVMLFESALEPAELGFYLATLFQLPEEAASFVEPEGLAVGEEAVARDVEAIVVDDIYRSACLRAVVEGTSYVYGDFRAESVYVGFPVGRTYNAIEWRSLGGEADLDEVLTLARTLAARVEEALPDEPTAPVGVTAAADNGLVAWTAWGGIGPGGDIFVGRPDGTGLQNLTTRVADDLSPAWSPDGKMIAWASDQGNPVGSDSIWVMSADGSGRLRVTWQESVPCPGLPSELCSPDPFYGFEDTNPSWSPGGTKVAFQRRARQSDIFVVNIDGTGLRPLTETTEIDEQDPNWSPDGETILFVRDFNELWIMNADGTDPRRIGPGHDPDWSPDGEWIAFNIFPLDGIFVSASDGSDARQLTAEGKYPSWSPDGTQIAFIGRDENIWFVDVDGEGLRQFTEDAGAYDTLDWQPLPAADAVPLTVHGVSETEALLDGIPQDGIALGEPEAPVTLVAYADLQCLPCADWSEFNLAMIVDEYVRTGEVRILLRGLAFIGPESEDALRAALAAGEQNKLWNFVELTFKNQAAPNTGWINEQSIRAIGSSVPGLDVESMMRAVDQPSLGSEIAVAEGHAQWANISATPAFQLGPTGESLRVVELNTADHDKIRANLDAAIAEATR